MDSDGYGLWLPILVAFYRRLSVREERRVAEAFGPEWDHYARRTPRFIPRLITHHGSGTRQRTDGGAAPTP